MFQMKKRMKECIHQLLKDESGQGTLEYALIVVAVVAVVAVFGNTIKQKLAGFINGTMNTTMEGLVNKVND